jgi:hypothetical protein
LRVVAGDRQTGAAGSPLPRSIIVEVTDSGGAPVAGAGVAFTIAAGGGTVSAPSVTSDASGQATTHWTVGTKPGELQQLTASIPSSASVPSIAISATSIAGPPVTLTPLPSNVYAGPEGSNLVLGVKAIDAIGNPASGAQLTWRFDPAPDGVAVTDSTGVAHFSVPLVLKAGPMPIIVEAGPTVSTTMIVQVLHAQFVKFVGLDSIAAPAGTSVTLTFTAVDFYDNPIPGQSLYAEEDVSIFGPPSSTWSVTTGADGVAKVQITLASYAGMESLNIYDSPGGTGRGRTTVYRTAARGAVLASQSPCVFPADISDGWFFPRGYVFGPNGHPASGIGLIFSVQPGNGFLLTEEGSSQHLSSYVGISDAFGGASTDWHVPPVTGTYHMSVQGPPGYDGGPPGDFECRVG